MATLPDETICWQAVENRDSQYDGVFVLGVKTTRIYCRPSCKARQPLRKNVTFFALPAAAEQAGFRPCKRCQPHQVAMRDEQVCRVQAICTYLQAHLDETVTLADLGAQFHLSPFHLQRMFAQVMGITPHQYAEAVRLAQFKARLKAGENVTHAIYSAGYGSTSRIYEKTESQMGMTPSMYQKGGAAMQIEYSTTPTNMGMMLVAQTERGICALMLGEDVPSLAQKLQAEFPQATLQPNAESVHPAITAVLHYLDGWQPHFDLPLDLRVTAFQKRVLDELCRIPYGETRTYGEIAAAIGSPQSARAVGRACATNPIPLIIPCHRVIGSDGSLTGYAYGTERKKRLLDMEKQGQTLTEEPAS